MRTRRSAVAFVMALIVIVVTVIILTSVGAAVGSKIMKESTQNESVAADAAARAGIERALASLSNQSLTVTTLDDDWYTVSQNGNVEFVLGNASFRMQIVDACSRIDINTVTSDWLLNVGLTQDQIDAILDWRTTGTTPSAQGAKDEFYNGLSVPYNTKLRRFDSFDELLLVKDIDAQTLYDPPTNGSSAPLVSGVDTDQPTLYDLCTVENRATVQNPSGQSRTNVNVANQQQLVGLGLRAQAAAAIIQRRNTVSTFANMGEVFQVAGLTNADAKIILDNLTTDNSPTAEGKINMNTATEQVLNSIPNMPAGLAQSIISRGGLFNSLGELADLPGVTPQTLRDIADKFTVSSQSFLVRVVGKSGSSRVAVEALVEFTNGQPVVTRVNRPWFTDAEQRWGWVDETTQQTVLMEAAR